MGEVSPAAAPTAYERHAPSRRLVDRALADTEHRVFWIEDVADTPSYRELTSATTADLTVVGGGYCGLWTAVRAKLRHPELRVVLLEAQRIGWAASGRNGGFCEASITHGEANGKSRWPDEYATLERLGAENLEGLAADLTALGIDAEFERTGFFEAAVEPYQVDALRAEASFLDAEAARAEIDSPLVLGAAWHREETALVHPAKLAVGLARAAAELGVEIHENTPVTSVDPSRSGPVTVTTARTTVTSDRVALATNVFPALVRRARLFTVPVYDYVLMTEPLTAEQRAAIGWAHRQGLGDMANQFHYSRLTADGRILWGGYDAIYHPGRKVKASYEERPDTYRKLAGHFLSFFPQLEDVRFSHRWAGAIDTCTQFAAFHGLTAQGRIAYSAGFTGLGVGATRFAAEVMVDRLWGETTERTELAMVRRKPLPFPPEPIATVGIELTRRGLDRADHRAGRRGPLIRTLDALGLGFDS